MGQASAHSMVWLRLLLLPCCSCSC
jgi:hypothetical protein